MRTPTQVSCAGVWLFVIVSVTSCRADDWPQWRGPNRDGSWRETGVIETFPNSVLQPEWSAPVGPGFSAPTVAGDSVFVMDRVVAPEQERVLCFERGTGRLRWVQGYHCVYRDVDYAIGPRAAVTLADGRAFSYGTMGHAHAFDTADGRILWRRDLIADFRAEVNFWGMSGSPLVAGDVVIFQVGGADGACLVALDVKTGRERWRALDGKASYSPPRLIRVGERNAVLAWTAQWLGCVDATSGTVLWKVPYKPSRMVHQVSDPVIDDSMTRVLLTSFYDGSQLFALGPGEPRLLWRRAGPHERKTDGIHSMVTTSLIRGGHAYGIDSHGELRCLDLTNGERQWENSSVLGHARWGTAHLVQNGDRTWITTEKGEIIIARLSPQGFEEISRARFITPDTTIIGRDERVTWSHPAYAHRTLFARSDSQLVAIPLAAANPE